ncbi:hypothetical protein F4813DRAFT_207424 [Daldinia decipiens]|uniref:uncharacterized protein n=1 Tax=Daldinia decipiens TaxID=326647 RepID=UPI0020C2276B|nr:uncharacterized protein F4813DRAFT_207424 [Daldinia decipiens]KAI1654390.1 hypothetical protein F4813DRAFT_207424 [Daldinia decipiens]
MADNSSSPAYYGATPSKPAHHFTENPPTSDPADKKSLQDYRLQLFKDGPNSVPLVDDRTPSSDNSQASHEAKVAAELEAILARLG